MTYRINPYEEAQDQIDALPRAGLLAYADAADVLESVPWNGEPASDDNPDGAVRALAFGPNGEGLVTYLILERDDQVDVISVHWAG